MSDVIKEGPFSRRVVDVRRATQVNMDAKAAVEYLRNGDQGSTGSHNIRNTGSFGLPAPMQNTGSNPSVRTTGAFNHSSDMHATGSNPAIRNTGGFVQPQPANYGGASGPFQRSDIVVRDLSEAEIDQKAFFDTSTPTYNLRFLLRNLHQELLRSQTFNRCVTIMVVSIDKFKDIGLDYGALALDSVISTAAKAIMATVRPVDMVGRFMEDRFIVVCPETDVHAAAEIAEAIRTTFEHITIPHQWHTIRFQANIGLAQFPGHGEDVESFIALADYASNLVAEEGGNGILLPPDE